MARFTTEGIKVGMEMAGEAIQLTYPQAHTLYCQLATALAQVRKEAVRRFAQGAEHCVGLRAFYPETQVGYVEALCAEELRTCEAELAGVARVCGLQLEALTPGGYSRTKRLHVMKFRVCMAL